MRKKTCPICKKPDTYHHGDLKHAILHASLKILAQQGTHALSLRAAAKEAGVSPAAPYRHFPNKAALLASMAAFGFDAISAALQDEAQHHPGNLLQQMLDAAIAYIRFSQEHPALIRMMYSIDPTEYPELDQAHRRTEDTFIQLIRRCQEEGIIQEGNAEDMAMVAFSFIHGLSVLVPEKHCEEFLPKGHELELWIRELCRIMWNGLGKKPILPGPLLPKPKKTKKPQPLK